MAEVTNELKVGLLAIVAAVAVGWSILRTDDRPDGAMEGYALQAHFPAADGVFESTQVKMAGVPVGSVRSIELEGGEALLRLELRGGLQLPVDSVAELKSEGILGDRYVRITPGTSAELLGPGDELKVKAPTADLDELQAKMGGIADDVKAITAVLRTTMESEQNQQQLKSTLGNVEQLSGDLADMARANRENLDAIATNLRLLSESLKVVVDRTGNDVNGEMAAIREATEKLDRSLASIEQITAKVERGEGTVGRLLNDDAAARKLEDTLDHVDMVVTDVQATVASITGIQTEVYYRGDAFFGSSPHEPGFDSNPMAGGARNIIGLELKPREDYWYLFEFVDHPIGVIDYTEHTYVGSDVSWTEYQRRPDFRYSFMFAKRFQNLVLRLGIKESAGGFGFDYLLARDRLMVSADLFDFEFGSWPVLDGTPNLELNLRVKPHPHLFLEAGVENTIFGIRHGYFTGYAGGGFSFTDDDLKWVLSALPLPN